MIYFGIGKDKKVFGLEMNREDRDEFRLGIDRLMHRKITPILLHSHFDVKLIPVLDPDQHSILTDLYVVGKKVMVVGMLTLMNNKDADHTTWMRSWSASLLFGYGKSRFCHDVAHIIINYCYKGTADTENMHAFSCMNIFIRPWWTCFKWRSLAKTEGNKQQISQLMRL